jgi:hypothetical protein
VVKLLLWVAFRELLESIVWRNDAHQMTWYVDPALRDVRWKCSCGLSQLTDEQAAQHKEDVA